MKPVIGASIGFAPAISISDLLKTNSWCCYTEDGLEKPCYSPQVTAGDTPPEDAGCTIL